jgi:hypothetical protein
MSAYRHKLISKSSMSGDDTVKLYRIDPATYAVVHVIRWDEYDSNADMGTYNATATVFALHGFDAHASTDGIGESVRGALQCCGMTLVSLGAGLYRIDTESGDVVGVGTLEKLAPIIIEAMFHYGAGDRMLDASGNNRAKLERAARGAF